MSLRLYTSKEDSENFSKSFSTKLYPKFERSTFLFVDFSLNKSQKDVFKIQVFYSENGFFYTKFISKEIIRHAFGKWNQLNFMLARDKNKPLTPLFIFDFPLNNSKSSYDAAFANINGNLHILSKIYDLSDEHFKLLKKSYKLYKVKGKNHVYFDFGNCFSFIDKFLNNLETILGDVDFKLNESDELIINPIPLDSIRKREDNYKFCMICGKKLESTLNKNLLELSRKFPARCENCLKKIYALDLYYKLNEGSISTNMLSTSELEYMWDEEGLFEYNFKLLKDYGFLKPFSDDIYKLYLNEDINEAFGSLLNPIEEKEEESKSRSALDDYFGFTDDKEKPKCRICGEEMEEDDGTDICSNCFDKQMSIEKIHKLIEYVKPGSGFSKSALIEKGFNHIDLDIIITDLEEKGLLRYDSDDLIILANKSNLNDFIKEYSDSDEYIIENTDEGLISTIVIYKDDLKDEQSLDKAINLIDYQEYIEFSSNSRIDGWYLTLKKEGKEFSNKLYYNPFKAKLAAVKYLNEIGIIKIADFDKGPDLADKPKSKKKSKNKDKYKYAPPEEGRGQKYNRICPVCGREFVSYKTDKGILCSSCISKYGFFEKKALEGIINGKFDKALLSNILLFREEGDSDLDIAKKLNIDHDFLIKPLIKFLSDDDLLGRISENLNGKDSSGINTEKVLGVENEKEDISINNSDSDDSVEEKPTEISTDNKSPNKKICPACHKEFISDSKKQMYCNECKYKYNNFELQVLSRINKGIYTEAMALRIKELLNQGYTKSKICSMFNIQNSILIDLILKFLLNEDLSVEETIPEEIEKNKDKTCPICKKTFVPRANQKYCNDCKSKFSPLELGVLYDIEQGRYTKATAIEIAKLKQDGKTNQQISNILKFSHPNVITPILNFLLKDADLSESKENSEEVEGISFNENLSKWFAKVEDKGKMINLGFYDTKEEAISARDKYHNPVIQSEKEEEYKLVKQLFQKDDGDNYTKIFLKGIISEKDRVSIFNFISFINCNLNKLLCEKREDNNYNFMLDIDIEKSRVKSALKDLKLLGWENAKQ